MKIQWTTKFISGLCLIMLAMVFLPLSRVAAATPYTSVKSGDWTDPTTWGYLPSDVDSYPHSELGDPATIDSGDTVSFSADTIVGGQLTINAGATLSTNDFKLTLYRDFLIFPTGIFSAGDSDIEFASGLTQGIAGFTTTGTVSMKKIGGSVATLNGNINAGGLVIDGVGGALDLGAGLTHTISTTFALTAGTLNGGSSILNYAGVTVSPVTGTFTAGSGTVNYNALGPQTVGTLTYNNLTVSGSGLKTTNTSIWVNGILSMEGTATISSSVPNYGPAATLRYNTSSPRNIGSEWKTTFASSGGIVIANTGVITISSTSTRTLNSGVPLHINPGATLATSASLTLTIGGDFTNQGTFNVASGTLTLYLQGNLANAGTLNLSTARIHLTGNAAQSIAGLSTTGAFYMEKLGGTATLAGDVSAGPLTINGAGGTLSLGSGLSHTFTSTWTMTAGTLLGGSSTLSVTGSENGTGATFVAGTSTVNYSGTSTQNIGGFTYFNLTTSGTQTKSTTGNVTVGGNLNVGAGTTLTVQGFNFAVSGTTTVGGTLIHSSNLGLKTYTGMVTVNGGWNNSGDSDLHFAGGFTYNGTSFPIDLGTYIFETGDQVISGTSAITISKLTVTGIHLTNTGNLTVNMDMNGTGTLLQGAGATLRIGGTSSLNLIADADDNTVNYSGAAQTVVGIPYYNLITSGSGIKTIAGNISMAGDLTVNSGTTLTLPGYSITVTGATMVDGTLIHSDSAGAKLYVGPVTVDGAWNNPGNASIHFRGGLTHSGTSFVAGTGVYTFETNPQNIGGVSPLSIPNVIVTGVTLTNTNSSAGGLSLTTSVGGTGTLAQAANTTLNLGGSASIALNATAVPNTVNYNGAVQTVIPTAYHHLTLSTSGVKTLTGLTTVAGNLSLSGTASATTAASLSVGGDLTLSNSAALTVAGYDFSVTGNTTLNNTSQLTHSSATGAKTFTGNVTINTGSTWSDNLAVIPISFGGSLQNSGTFNSGTGVHTFTGLAKTFGGTLTIPNVTITGAYTNGGTLTAGMTLAGTGSLTQAASATLNVGGSLDIDTLTATANLNTVRYTLSNIQTIRSMTYHHLATGGTSAKTLAGNVIINGNLTIGTDTFLDVSPSNYGISLLGNWINNGNSAAFIPQAGTVTLMGAVSQDMSGATVFNNLTVNNSAGVTLSSSQTINGALTLTSGKVTTSASSDVILGTSGHIDGADLNKYINGNLQKLYLTGGPQTFVYDIGDGTQYTRLTLAFANITTEGGVTAKTTGGGVEPLYIFTSGLDAAHDVHRSWTLTASTAFRFSTVDATFRFVEADIDALSDPDIFIAKRRSGGTSDVWYPTTVGTRTPLPTPSTQVTGLDTLGVFAIGQPDVTAPVVTNVTSTAADSRYTVGAIIPITITFNEGVHVDISGGRPQLTLHTAGSADRVAIYYSGDRGATLTFRYTVQAGDTSGDLDYLNISSLSLNGGTMRDFGGNDANLQLPPVGAAGSLGFNKNIIIDTTSPTVTNVTSTNANGTYKNGNITVTVTFTEVVTVVTSGGTPSLLLETGPVDRSAIYSSGSGTNTLSFVYAIQVDDITPDLNYASTLALITGGGTIRDTAGNNAALALPGLAAAGSLGTNKNIVIDATATLVTNVTSTTANGAYRTGNITVTVTFNKPVTVVGAPTLTLETGSQDRFANLTAGSGTNTLSFTYSIQPGDTTGDLEYVAIDSLVLNGGTIKDALGNNAILTLPVKGTAGSLGYNKNIVIDTTAPTTTISGKPTNPQSDSTPTFTFGGSDVGGSGVASFLCRMDTGGYSACASPFTPVTPLPDGSHTFYVYAIDLAGNFDATPDSFTWRIDTLAPDTTITVFPAPTDATPTFSFTGTDGSGSGVASFMCKIDSGAPSACASPFTPVTPLPDGTHSFYVYTVDLANNSDPTPDSFTWTVDTLAPTTTITAFPAADDTTPTFSFSGNDGSGSGVVSFMCRMDTAAYSDCLSPVTWTMLLGGQHTFYVYAVDLAGNSDATPASYTWTLPGGTLYRIFLPMLTR